MGQRLGRLLWSGKTGGGTYDGADERVAGDEGDSGAGRRAGGGRGGATSARSGDGACRRRGSGEALGVVFVRNGARPSIWARRRASPTDTTALQNKSIQRKYNLRRSRHTCPYCGAVLCAAAPATREIAPRKKAADDTILTLWEELQSWTLLHSNDLSTCTAHHGSVCQ